MARFTEPIHLKLEKEMMDELNIAIAKDGRDKANAVRRGIQIYINIVNDIH